MTRSSRSSRPAPADLPAPRFLTESTGPSYGAQLEEIATLLGLPPLPVQRQIYQLAGEVDEHQLLANRLLVISLPRRSGKTESAGVVAVWRCLRRARLNCWWTAQSRTAARDSWSDLADRLTRSPLAARVSILRGTGSETIRFDNGSSIRIFPPSEKALHGRLVDVVVVDESWSLSEAVGQAIMTSVIPATATSAEPQVILTSSAGTGASQWWAGWVERMRRGEGAAGVDAGLPAGLEPSIGNIAEHHPSVGTLITLERLQAMAQVMTAEDFTRSFANVPSLTTSSAIDELLWTRCGSTRQFPQGVPWTLGLDYDADRQSAAVVGAVRLPGGKVGVELIRSAPGTNWVLGYVTELMLKAQAANDDSFLGVGADSRGPAAAVLDLLLLDQDLRESKRTEANDSGRLVPLTTADWTKACGQFFDLVTANRLVHRNQPELDQAVQSSTQRRIGDGFAWMRRNSRFPSSPLTAATAAAAVLQLTPDRLPPRIH